MSHCDHGFNIIMVSLFCVCLGLSPRSARTPGKNSRTPGKDRPNGSKTPGTAKTPGAQGKTPGKEQIPPQQKGRWKTPSKTPSKKGLSFGQQDRYINFQRPNNKMCVFRISSPKNLGSVGTALFIFSYTETERNKILYFTENQRNVLLTSGIPH